MKTWQETVTRQEGEWFTPVDPNYDFMQHGMYPNDPEYALKVAKRIYELEKAFNEGKEVLVWYGPIIRAKVLRVGMYDGWPFWKPTPAVLLEHWYKPETRFWMDIQSWEVKE